MPLPMNPDFPSDFTPQGEVRLPSSKSLVNRLLVMSALAGSEGPVQRSDEADDVRLMRKLLNRPSHNIDVGMAGTVCRFLTAWLSIQPGEFEMRGAARMHERPIGVLVDALRKLGASITYLEDEGFLPLLIRGKVLKGGSVVVAGDISSQYISALLMIGPYLKNGLKITIEPPFYSAPYVRMTTQLMQRAGAKLKWNDQTVEVEPGKYSVVPAAVESDWSAAAFFYELLAVAGKGQLFLPNLYKDSLQGDSRCHALFRHFGVVTEFVKNGAMISVREKRLLPDFVSFDCSDFPDLVQPLACACAGLRVRARFSGIKSLRIKETDRVAALKSELNKLGVRVDAGADYFELCSFGSPSEIRIETYNDHRMAMAFAPLALKFPGLTILKPEVVAKSFPKFWQQLRQVTEPNA